jgi:hypothetical protein
VKNAPGKEEVENFWREIYGKKVPHNGEACWIKDQPQENRSMEWSPVCEKDVAEALRTTLNRKPLEEIRYQILGLNNLQQYTSI